MHKTTQMNLKRVMLRARSQSLKILYCMTLVLGHSQKDKTIGMQNKSLVESDRADSSLKEKHVEREGAGDRTVLYFDYDHDYTNLSMC